MRRIKMDKNPYKDITLSDSDEEILDRVWAQIAADNKAKEEAKTSSKPEKRKSKKK